MKSHLNRRTLLTNAAIGLSIAPFSTMLVSTALAAGKQSVSYGANSLDIYTPSNPANAPVILYVHGGAWRLGNRGQIGSKAKYYTSKGYVFVSVSYTLYPKADAEKQAVQVAQAINWVKKNIGAYGGDGSRIAAMGHSAGCHLVSLAVLSGAARPKLLICVDTGAYDLQYLSDISGGRIPALYSALNTKEKFARWSPISYVGNGATPPILVIWSKAEFRDKVSTRFVNALSGAGASVTSFEGNGYSHLSINSSIGSNPNDQVTAAIDRFLSRL